MEKFVAVHPVITRVDHVEDDNYLLYETLGIWIISFSFSYPVNIKINADKKLVVMDAWVMRLVKIEMNFLLRELNGITLVEEEIHFNTWLPVKWLMKSIFKKQHARLFKNIEQLQSPQLKVINRMPNTD
jgi:hypothetical protein